MDAKTVVTPDYLAEREWIGYLEKRIHTKDEVLAELVACEICQLVVLTDIIISNNSYLLERSCTNIMEPRSLQNARQSRVVAPSSRDPS